MAKKDKSWKCPKCKKMTQDFPAISRRDNKTKICSQCGVDEAMEDYYKSLQREAK